MKTPSNSVSQQPAAGEMTALSDDLTHFFENEHFCVRKARCIEEANALLRVRETTLVEALLMAQERITELSRFAGLPENGQTQDEISAAIASAKVKP